MPTRSKFIKSEIRKTYNLLNLSYEYAGYAGFEDEKKIYKNI